MAGRPNVTAGMLAQLNALQSRPGHLIEAYFDDETVRATDFYASVPWNGNTYLANGDLLSYEGLSEQLDMQAAQVRVALQGVDQVWIQRILSKSYLTRRLVVYKAMCDAAWNVVLNPSPAFDGEMKRPQIATDPDQGTCTVVITASHPAADVDNAGGRRTNDATQRVLFPTDGIFKYAAQAKNRLVWGSA